ncbi:unnamed protein product, partial [Allacma fusca]
MEVKEEEKEESEEEEEEEAEAVNEAFSSEEVLVAPKRQTDDL